MEDKIIKQAFICGYEQGHSDTVESGYGCSPDKADEYFIELADDIKAQLNIKQSIIDLINEAYNKVLEEKRNNYDHTEFYVSGLLDGKLTLLTELKGKIEQL